MPFLIPIVAGVAGIISAHNQQKRTNHAQDLQNNIAQQEMGDKQQIFDKLVPFFSQYLKDGSPFLQMIQRASAEQHATQGNNAAGQVRQTMQSSGQGFGPSGATAAAIGGVASENAKSSASDYLTNLLNNEQVKFQAAQGLNQAGAMAGQPQNQPNVSTQVPAQSTASAIGSFGDILTKLITPNGSSGSSGGGMPGPAATSGYGSGMISF